MVSWGSIKSLLFLFGPLLLPKAISYYRSMRAPRTVTGKKVQPVPPAVNRALLILFSVAVVFLISTFPYFAPENIFVKTQSRLQIPNDVLFTRLNALRPKGLTEFDNDLRHKVASLESRLLYFKFGPDAIANCLWCSAEDPTSYLYYAIPGLLGPHLFNLCILALVTSGLFVGTEGTLWRKTATIAALGLAGSELWIISSNDHQQNAKAKVLDEIDAFYWKMRVYRGVGIAVMDALLGWVIYLSSTNRAFVKPLSAAERIEMSIQTLDVTRSKMSAAGVVRNTVIRDQGLRDQSQTYWIHEGRVMREMMEDREVLEGVNDALENRINIDTISADAEAYAGRVVRIVPSAEVAGNI